jgi:phage tail sheath protein FI
MLDPTGQSASPILVPPSGYVAGLFAKTDAQRGVWKAPAGTAVALGGAVGLAVNFTDVQQGNLNPLNINVLRQFAAAGTVLWGARTITSDAEWQYIPVRRTAIMLRVSIYNGIQWAVFEPNDEPLWSQLRLNIGSFMMTLFRQGAFQGSTPSKAFFIKCDAETTTQADIDLGIVNILVGFAPLKPAEFIVVKISQKAGQASS